MTEFDKVKQEYANFKEEMKDMFRKERDILKRLQAVCPHENTYIMDTEPMFEDFMEQDQSRKCKDCGKILKPIKED